MSRDEEIHLLARQSANNGIVVVVFGILIITMIVVGSLGDPRHGG